MAKKPLKLAPKKSGGKKGGEGELNVEKALGSQQPKLASSKIKEELEDFDGDSHFEISDEPGLDIDKTVVNLDLETKSRVIEVKDFKDDASVKPSEEDQFVSDDISVDEEKLEDDKKAENEADEFSFKIDDDLAQQNEPDLNFSLDDDVNGKSEANLDVSLDEDEQKSSQLSSESPNQENLLDDSLESAQDDQPVVGESLDHSESAEDFDLGEKAEAAPEMSTQPEMNQVQAQAQGSDLRPTTEGKRLCACGHCGVEYYLLKELVHREALCVKCQKVFVIEFSPNEELLVVNEEVIEEIGGRDFDVPEEDRESSIEEGGTISIDYGTASETQSK